MADKQANGPVDSEATRDLLADALAADDPLDRLDRVLEALARLSGDSALVQTSMWFLPRDQPEAMQRIRGRYLVRGGPFDETLLPGLFVTDLSEAAEAGARAIHDRIRRSTVPDVIDDYASICGPRVYHELAIYREVIKPLGLENGFTHYWRVNDRHCLNSTVWLADQATIADLRFRAQAASLFVLAKPLIERVFVHDHVGHAIEGLTDRQREVLRHVLAGFSEKQMAARLHRSIHTIHTHVRDLYREFEVQSRAELMSLFVDEAALASAEFGHDSREIPGE